MQILSIKKRAGVEIEWPVRASYSEISTPALRSLTEYFTP